jgi:hypothetical protein
MSEIRKEWYDRHGRRHVKIMDEKGIRHLIDPDPSEISQQPESSGNSPNERWYKKPIGIIALAVSGGLILLLIGAAFRHFWPRLFP